MKRPNRSLVVRLIVSVLALGVVFYLIDIRSFGPILAEIDIVYYLGGILLYVVAIMILALRLRVILAAAGVRMGLFSLVEINMVGQFFSLFLPTAVGGDVARMYELSHQSSHQATSTSISISAVLLDRIIGLFTLALLSVVGLVVGAQFIPGTAVKWAAFSLLFGLIFAWWLLLNRRLMAHFQWIFQLPLLNRSEETVKQLYNLLYYLNRQPKLIVSCLIISLVVQSMEILSVVMMAQALDIHIAVFTYFIFVPLIWLVTMMPLSLNGIGFREGAYIFFFGQAGVLPALAVLLSLLVFSARVLVGLLGGLLFLKNSLIAYRQNRSKPWASVEQPGMDT
ncbi:MAG: flippase-like domain-containing protein [Chloroflexi bacterium]|nr:flippase-like domain-containing protein [Chloroflexota bacterium]